MMRLLLTLVLLGTAACAEKHELAKCEGVVLALNTDRWKPSPEQQAEMDRLATEACR
ncbi:hypothetical protein [Paracraurococcus lichenis]|uniref:Uncharacterized protein n=1 Tax=Paracraurococcus lichenis TaxID=3064888 RepID=A0ABT9EB44_9PROT|nr:hypothetical protein [Paracraurococcus sp. LOR1-02]MDO9713255.1 hypothetical protein [Paracraurococcus sp. LOR1-02]